MINPYEVLGIKENASQEEIKKAYREKVKQYHPDQYGDNPLKDLAEEKLREINEAYDTLMKKTSSNNYGYSNSNSGYNQSSSYSQNHSNSSDLNGFQQVRMDINRGDIPSAENRLNSISNRNAEWQFLMGMVHLRKGWYDSAYNLINTACRMEPNNFEYKQALNQLHNRQNSYRNTYYGQRNSSNDICDMCFKIWMLDTCCECMGGNCI